MRKKLLAAGVRNLKQYGYPHVNEENILTDIIYSAFFKGMLEDAPLASVEVTKLLEEIKANNAKRDREAEANANRGAAK